MKNALVDYLREAGVEIENGQVVLPDWVKKIKIDAGLSYSASNAIQWIREDPTLLVFGFEPLPESCKILRRWISEQEDSNILDKQLIILPLALGQEPGVAKLHITDDDTASSSLLRPKKMRERSSIDVQVFPLSDLFQALPWGEIKKVDYLKLDCQGLDLEILKTVAGGGWLNKIALVTAEPEDEQYEGSRNSLGELVALMKEHGFIQLNARSEIRVFVGKFLSRLQPLKGLKIRFPVLYKKEVVSPNLSVLVEDPTFVNRAFLKQVRAGEITAYQVG